MTKAELEKEAEEYALANRSMCVEGDNADLLKEVFLDVAEPREKQIQIDAEQIRALQKQNGELTDELKTLRESVKDYGAKCYENGLRNGKRKLEQQIEKMKQELEQAKKVKVVEHFEAYGQCRDSRRIAELEAKLKHAEENCINKTCVVFKDKEDCVAKLLELEKENAELKSDNDARKFAMAMSEKVEKQLREENANDEGYARTLQTIQLSKAKDLLNEFMRISKASDEDFEHDYSELIGEAEQFISEVEK